MEIIHADFIGAVANVHVVFGQETRLKFHGGDATFYAEQDEIGACWVDLDFGDGLQRAVEPADVGDQALSGLVIGPVRGEQHGEKVLGDGVNVPGWNELAHSIENEQVGTVAVAKAQTGHPAVLAHAANEQKIGETFGERKETGDGIVCKINE